MTNGSGCETGKTQKHTDPDADADPGPDTAFYGGKIFVIYYFKRRRWVAKLIARQLAAAALWVRIPASLINIKLVI